MFCSFFFFKQKTAYEMRISDWSSDVCSSDLDQAEHQVLGTEALDHPKDAAGGVEARLVRHRMRRLHHLDGAAGNGVAVAGDHQALERCAVGVRPMVLAGPPPGGGRLSQSEERRVGKGGGRTCRIRWLPANSK